MRVFFYDNVHQNANSYIDLKPSEFLDLIADEEQIPSEYCPAESDKMSGSGFVIGSFRGDAPPRRMEYLEKNSSTQVLVYDIDDMSDDEIAERLCTWVEYDVALYPTWKHRYRMLLALDKPVSHADKSEYKRIYDSVAKELGIKYDKAATDTVRLSFFPQHKEENQDTERARFRGKPFEVRRTTSLEREVLETSVVSDAFETTGDRPSRQELKIFARKLRTSRSPESLKVATMLDAVLREEPYAPAGSRHAATLRLTMALVREWPALDCVWFAKEYLESIWPSMWGDEDGMRDWTDAVQGAKTKIENDRSAREAAAAALAPKAVEGLTQEQTQAVLDRAGRLVISVEAKYLVYSPIYGAYRGPFVGADLPVALRDMLGMFEGVTELKTTKRTQRLKTATEICHEYGTTGNDIIWSAGPPEKDWDPETRSVYIQAYQWMDWVPRKHQIAAELLEAMVGKEKVEDFVKYLTKFRDLGQPLPALTFIGPGNTWKSRVCSILSRFWTDRDVSHSNNAEKVLTRFNDALLRNPICWSDEKLVTNFMGKPMTEIYRESITSYVQHIEAKRMPTMRLKSCIRHVVTAHEDDKIFPHEVDFEAVKATMGRFLMFYTDTDRMQAFEDRWRGTEEMDRLREGSSFLEHVVWLEENFTFESESRLFVAPKTDEGVLLRTRFNDDTLNYILGIAFEALDVECRMSNPGQIDRLPLVVDDKFKLRLSPGRIMSLWANSKTVSGSGMKKPTAQRIGNLLCKAGFKKHKLERAVRSPHQAWEVNLGTLKEYLEVSEQYSWSWLEEKCETLFGRSF